MLFTGASSLQGKMNASKTVYRGTLCFWWETVDSLDPLSRKTPFGPPKKRPLKNLKSNRHEHHYLVQQKSCFHIPKGPQFTISVEERKCRLCHNQE